jgi:hypothetical protein
MESSLIAEKLLKGLGPEGRQSMRKTKSFRTVLKKDFSS